MKGARDLYERFGSQGTILATPCFPLRSVAAEARRSAVVLHTLGTYSSCGRSHYVQSHPPDNPRSAPVAFGRMKFAAFLQVKDEAELVDRAIDHLRAIGVDLIVACDKNSTDGTLELLQARRSDDRFWLILGTDADAEAGGWFTAASEALVKIAQANYDWLLFLDADEFWIPASGQLRDCISLAEADVLSVPRFNIPLVEGNQWNSVAFEPCHYEDLLAIVEPIPDFRAFLRGDPEMPWIRGVPAPKVMARPTCVGGVTMGAHDIIAAGDLPTRHGTPLDLFIAHLPFTTKTRFARKIANIRKFFALHDQFIGKDRAWHWRRWLEIVDREGLDREFDRNVFSLETCGELRRQGIIRSARDIFRAKMVASE